MNYKDVPWEHVKGMMEAYVITGSIKKVIALYGYPREIVLQALKEFGKVPQKGDWRRKYKVNQNFFDWIGDETTAYWLGFFSADGCIADGAIMISLQATDDKYLYKFAAAIESNHPINYYESNGHLYVKIAIYSAKLVKVLKELGVTARKADIIRPCTRMSDHLLHHYWRGVIDGDGSIWYDKASNSWRINLTGNKYMTKGFADYIKQFVKTNAQVRFDGESFVIPFGGTSVTRAVCQVLYGDATVYLDRKMKLAQQILAGE